MKQILRITTDDAAIITRAREIVTEIVAKGHDHHDIARLTDTTVVSLLHGASPTLRRPQFNALARHYQVSRLWLWTGLGPRFIDESKLKSTTIS